MGNLNGSTELGSFFERTIVDNQLIPSNHPPTIINQ